MNAKNNRWRSQKMNSSRELITTPNRIRIMRNIAGLILGLIWLCTTLYQFTSTAPTPTSLTQNSIEIVQKEKDAPPHTSNWFATNFTFPTVEERVEREGSKCKKAALILFGVPSHFQYIWKSYMKYIVQRNPQLHFEVYMHMYSDLHQQPFSSSRSAVRNAKLESPDDVWEILRKGSVLAGITTSSQSTFDESELSWLQQSDTIGFWDYPFQTLQNMFRQGNSLRESLLYLQDQKKHSNDIDVYIFARSDTMLLTPIDIPCSGIGGNEIWVPSWGSWSGINDRFAIAGPNAAKVYASRIEGYKEAMLARRSNPKALPPFNNSEMLHKNWLLKNLLNVTQMGDEWAKLSRVRADGRMHHSDHPSHIATLLNGTVRLDANGNLINVHIAAVAEK